MRNDKEKKEEVNEEKQDEEEVEQRVLFRSVQAKNDCRM